MKGRLIAAGIVAAAGLLLALALWIAGPNPWFHLGAPLATLLAFGSLLAAGLVLLLGARRSRARARIEAAAAAVRAEERAARRRFLRRLDHEMKNPVTAIRTALASIDEAAFAPAPPGSPASAVTEPLRVAGAQAARLSNLVTELAKLADLETRPIDFAPVDLEEIAREAADAVSSIRPDRLVRIEFPRVPWPVPPVAGDPDLLVVAVYNLVSNAAKYSDPGASIEVRGSESDGFVTLEVSDTGWGMAPEELPGAWDELARGTNTRGEEGSGLGLSIVRVIAERHGGTATIRSALGTGTRVALRLPALRTA